MKWKIKSFLEFVWDNDYNKLIPNPELEEYMNQGWEPFAIHREWSGAISIYIKQCTQEGD